MALQMRLYLPTSCGALLVPGYAPALGRFPTVGKEAVGIGGAEELIERLPHGPDHAEESSSVAPAGRGSRLERHSYARGILEFDGLARQHMLWPAGIARLGLVRWAH